MIAPTSQTNPMGVPVFWENIKGIVGNNFSGRTRVLRSLTWNNPRGHSTDTVYVGPEIYTSLSGLTHTVLEELLLHARCHDDIRTALDALKHYHLEHLIDRHPLEVSGGEQAFLVLLCKMASHPSIVAFDGTFEQMDQKRRIESLHTLEKLSYIGQSYLVDNRFGEWTSLPAMTRVEHYEIPPIQTTLDIQPWNRETQYSWNGEKVCIKISDLSFSYASKEPDVLQHVNLELNPGRIYQLIGQNGSGKSTFSKLMCGYLRNTRGIIEVNGRRQDFWNTPGVYCAYHFQNPDTQFCAHTVYNEFYSHCLLHRKPKDAKDLVERYLTDFGFKQLSEYHPMDLPFALRKRLAIFLVLSSGRPWLIFDEPTLAQDSAFAAFFCEQIKHLADSGRGIIIITHSETMKRTLEASNVCIENGNVTA